MLSREDYEKLIADLTSIETDMAGVYKECLTGPVDESTIRDFNELIHDELLHASLLKDVRTLILGKET